MTYAEITKNLAEHSAELLRNEFNLMHLELTEIRRELRRQMLVDFVFVGFFALAALALLASVIIGLGDLLGGRYGLSALAAAAACAALGGLFMGIYYERIQLEDFTFPRTRRSLTRMISDAST